MSIESEKKYSTGLRATAVLVVFMFTVTSVTWALPMSADTAVVTARSSPSPDALFNFVVPEDIGHIEFQRSFSELPENGTSSAVRHPSSDGKFVVLVQDAHAIVDAQQNIQKLIEHCDKAYGVRLVALEGAKSKLDPTLFRTFPDKNIKKQVLSGYLKRGEITGVQMAAIFDEKERVFSGIEDWDLYEGNYLAYSRAQDARGSLDAKWKAFKVRLDEERKTVYSEKLNEFQDRWEAFRAERTNFSEFLMYLVNFKKVLGRNPELSELDKLVDSVGYAASGDQEKLDPLIRAMAVEFKAKYARGMAVQDEMNFYNSYQAFLTGKMEGGPFLQRMIELGNDRGFRPKLTSAMQRLLGHTETLSAIKGSRLFAELQRGMETIERSLIAKPEEEALAGKYRRLFLLRELFSLELTHEALEQYQKDPEAYRDLLEDPAFRKGLAPAEEFYKLALERDQAFYKNLTALMDDQKQSSALVVAGGFHTNGLRRILEERKISYAVVSPRMASLEGSENYAKVMRDEVSYKEYLKTTYYDAFVRDATRRLVGEMNPPDFVRGLKTWRDDVIRDLSRQGRITEAGEYTRYLDLLAQVYVTKFGKGPARSNEELLKTIEKELNDFRDKSLEQLQQRFELQLGRFINGLKGLLDGKPITSDNVASLLESVGKTKPSMLGIPVVLDPSIGRSEVRSSKASKIGGMKNKENENEIFNHDRGRYPKRTRLEPYYRPEAKEKYAGLRRELLKRSEVREIRPFADAGNFSMAQASAFESVLRNSGAQEVAEVGWTDMDSIKFNRGLPPAMLKVKKEGTVIKLSFEGVWGDPVRQMLEIWDVLHNLPELLIHEKDFIPPEQSFAIDYTLRELLKNAWFHGNGLRMDAPVYLWWKDQRLWVGDLRLGSPEENGNGDLVEPAKEEGVFSAGKGLENSRKLFPSLRSEEMKDGAGKIVGTIFSFAFDADLKAQEELKKKMDESLSQETPEERGERRSEARDELPDQGKADDMAGQRKMSRDSSEISPVGVYFAWQAYMTMITTNTLFPPNPGLVVDFKSYPDKYPLMKAVFEEANTVFPGVNFFDLMGANLAGLDPSIVRIGSILFAYGLVKEWMAKGDVSLEGITFTSGGIFPALLLSESMDLPKGLPFIKKVFDYLFLRAEGIQREQGSTSALLTGGPTEDILILLDSIIKINPRLNQVTFLKEYRAPNVVIANGPERAVKVLSDIFINGGESEYVVSREYNAPEFMGDFIPADPRHGAVTYRDLPLHTPQVDKPEWWNREVQNLDLQTPKSPIFAQRGKIFGIEGGKRIGALLESAIFGFIDTAGGFEFVAWQAPEVALVGAPREFIKQVKNVVPFNTFNLTDPSQPANSAIVGKTPGADAFPRQAIVEKRSEVRIGELVVAYPAEVAKMVATNGVEAVRSEIREQGDAELRRIKEEYDAGTKFFVEDIRKEKNLFDFIITPGCEALLTKQMEGLVQFMDFEELYGRILNSVVMPETFASEMKFADAGKDLNRDKIRSQNARLAELIQNSKSPRITILMNRPAQNQDAEQVLGMIRQLPIEQLIVLHGRGQPMGSSWRSAAQGRLTPVLVKEKDGMPAMAQKIAKGRDGQIMVSFWTQDLGVGNLGIYSMLAEISRIADPELKSLALKAVHYALLRFASLDKKTRQAIVTDPVKIKEYLDQSIPALAFFKFGKNGLELTIDQFVNNYLAEISIQTAA